MAYVLLRYHGYPSDTTDLRSTIDAAFAVALVRRWHREHPDEGLIVAINEHIIVHCPPGQR